MPVNSDMPELKFLWKMDPAEVNNDSARLDFIYARCGGFCSHQLYWEVERFPGESRQPEIGSIFFKKGNFRAAIDKAMEQTK